MTDPQNPADFDAADLADAILGADTAQAPLPPPPPTTTHRVGSTSSSGAFIGPALIVALVAAVGLAIILAIAPAGQSQPPQPCGGLYSECCDDNYGHTEDHIYIDCEPPCNPLRLPPGDEPGGLFDAEDRFAEDPVERC